MSSTLKLLGGISDLPRCPWSMADSWYLTFYLKRLI